jgi:hypothetical protein
MDGDEFGPATLKLLPLAARWEVNGKFKIFINSSTFSPHRISLLAYVKTGIALRGSDVPLGKARQTALVLPFMVPSFHTVDRQTYRRVVVVGLLLGVVFLTISFFLRSRMEESRALVKADRLIRTAGEAKAAN